MAGFPKIGNSLRAKSAFAAIVVSVTVASLFMSSCNPLPAETIDALQTRIESHLKNEGIYDRNVEVEELPANTRIEGYYDMMGGIYRRIMNENREAREDAPTIEIGDSISFYFDARIFTNNYVNATTYFTNIASRIEYISNNNPEFAAADWSAEPLRIKVGDDDRILKAIHTALPLCKAAGQRMVDDGEGGFEIEEIDSDEVRIYLTPDLAYGNKSIGIVPAKSMLVWELTNITIIE